MLVIELHGSASRHISRLICTSMTTSLDADASATTVRSVTMAPGEQHAVPSRVSGAGRTENERTAAFGRTIA